MARSPKLKEIRANRFVVEDAQGQTKGLFEAMPDGLVFLTLNGSGGAGFSVTIDVDGNPKVALRNKKGRVVVTIGVSDDFGQGITISDSEGYPVCFLFTASDGIPRMRLFKVTSPTRGKKFWGTPLPKTKKKKRKPRAKS